MVNTRAETAANASAFLHEHAWVQYGMCLKWSRTMAGIPAKYDDAITCAHHSALHKGTPPRGTFVYFRNRGSGEHGHICISAGDDNVYSTDIEESNHVDRVTIRRIETKWNMEFIGWSDECNDRVLEKEPAPAPKAKLIVSLRAVQAAFRKGAGADPALDIGDNDIEQVQQALNKRFRADLAITGVAGGRTRHKYAVLQCKLLSVAESHAWPTPGYLPDANGIPGRASLEWLGFDVR